MTGRTDADIADWLDLSLVPGLGPRAYRELLSAFGFPSQVLAATPAQLARVVGETLAREIRSSGRAAAVSRTLAWLEQPGNHVVTLADPDFPPQLLEIPDPPPLLYVRGDPAWLARSMLAIVGSRNATAAGKRNAESFAQAIAARGYTIVSGLALGIDAAAHAGALREPGSTVGVLGTGLDIVYPRSNAALFETVAARGAIVSEFALGTPPLGGHFPRRNRLISGLARGVLVVEAAVSSGSLITARLAAEQGREIFAIPGSIHSPVSRGCHALIKQGAKLVESAEDVLEEIGAPPGPGAAASMRSDSTEQAPSMHNQSLASTEFLRHMGFDPVDKDRLAAVSGLTPAEVSAMLLSLELDGEVASLPGGLYQRTR